MKKIRKITITVDEQNHQKYRSDISFADTIVLLEVYKNFLVNKLTKNAKEV